MTDTAQPATEGSVESKTTLDINHIQRSKAVRTGAGRRCGGGVSGIGIIARLQY